MTSMMLFLLCAYFPADTSPLYSATDMMICETAEGGDSTPFHTSNAELVIVEVTDLEAFFEDLLSTQKLPPLPLY